MTKHETILAFLMTSYMDILIFNVYRTVQHTTNSNKQLLDDVIIMTLDNSQSVFVIGLTVLCT